MNQVFVSRLLSMSVAGGISTVLLLGGCASALLAPNEGASIAVIGGADGSTAVYVSDGGSDDLMGEMFARISFDEPNGAIRMVIPEGLPDGWVWSITVAQRPLDLSQSNGASAGSAFSFSAPGAAGIDVELRQLACCRVEAELIDSDACNKNANYLYRPGISHL